MSEKIPSAYIKAVLAALFLTVSTSNAAEDDIKSVDADLIVPELTSIAEVDGKPIATSFALLDYNPRIKQINGRLLPFGFLKLLLNRKKIKTIRVISSNVIPAYQKWGVGLVVLSKLAPAAIEWGIQEAEFSWVLESNQLSFGTLKRGGAEIAKTYRIYDSC